jgi:hypothetical protein
MIDATVALRDNCLILIPESHSWTSSVVDPHHQDADADSELDLYPDADPDSDFYLMRIRIFI